MKAGQWDSPRQAQQHNKTHRLAQQLAQALRHRLEAALGLLALGAALQDGKGRHSGIELQSRWSCPAANKQC